MLTLKATSGLRNTGPLTDTDKLCALLGIENE